MSKKVDARIARSKSSMAMALERLLQQKCLTDITVKDITDAAQLSKNTFYNNFSCKQDLLDYLLSGYADEVKELVAKGGPYKQEDKIMRFTQAISHILFTKIEKFRKIFRCDVYREVYWGIMTSFKNQLMIDLPFNFRPEATRTEIELACDFFSGALVNSVYAVSRNGFSGTENDFYGLIYHVWELIFQS